MVRLMGRRFDIAFYTAVGMCLVGSLGLAVTEILPDVSNVLTRTTFVFWG
jgi:hypothetical protein